MQEEINLVHHIIIISSSDLNFSKEWEQLAGRQQQQQQQNIHIHEVIILEDEEGDEEEQQEQEEEEQLQPLIAQKQQQPAPTESIAEPTQEEEEEEDLSMPQLITEEQRQQAERIDIVIEAVAHAHEEEQEGERGRSMEIEVIEENEEPLRKIIKRVNGHKRQYYFLEAVKSMEELDRTRFTVILRHKYVFLYIPTFPLELLPVCSRKTIENLALLHYAMRMEKDWETIDM
jgi:hypothetical protein